MTTKYPIQPKEISTKPKGTHLQETDTRSKLSTNHDGKPIEVNPFLHTEEKHRDWYEPNVMGKQRGKPQYDLKETKKPKK